ncbi:hypothetical protein JCM16138_11160 [Thermococcus atlanticus]
MEASGFKCERCGAPLDVSPETIVAVCPYCGFPNHISGSISTENIFIAPSLGKDEVYRAFMHRVERDVDLRSLRDDIQVVEIEGRYVPYWEGRVYLKGEVKYMRRETECHTVTDSQGNTREECHTVERHYHEFIDRNLHLMGSARRQVTDFGINDIIKHYKKKFPELKPLKELDEDEWQRIKLEILNTEMDERQARMLMKEDAVDVVREEYKAKSDRIEYFRCMPGEPEDVKLVLLPVWTVYYRYGNSIFKVAFSGWDGKDVAATEPMTALRRAMYVGGIILGIVIGGIGAGAISSGAAIIPLVAGAGIAYYSGSKVLAGTRVER